MLLHEPSLMSADWRSGCASLYPSSARPKYLTPIPPKHSRMSMDASGLVGADRETGGVFDPLGLANNKDDETLGWCVRLFVDHIIHTRTIHTKEEDRGKKSGSVKTLLLDASRLFNKTHLDRSNTGTARRS